MENKVQDIQVSFCSNCKNMQTKTKLIEELQTEIKNLKSQSEA